MITEERGKVIAFSSFKGGTGRTMALANIGCVLAQEPGLERPVLLVDWDLEAPGLHRYFRKRLFNRFNGDEALQDEAPGLIDLFVELRSQIAGGGEVTPNQDLAALFDGFPLASYIFETDIPRLHLLKAGRFDREYAVKIGSFNWPDLYRQSPHLLRGFADRLARDYSFVIIDSRTGLTDTSGICAMLMPEILVTVFTPNLQNLSGVINLVRDAARYRTGSDDLRPLLVYPLPSRIEASEPGLRHSWRFGDLNAGVPGFQGAFEDAFKEIYALPGCNLSLYFDDVQIQHAPRYAYGEEIAVLVEETRDRFSLTRSYQRFAARLLKGDTPWEGAAPPDESVDQLTLPVEPVERASRRRASDAYVKRIEEQLAQLDRVARRFRRWSALLYLSGYVVGPVVLVVLVWLTDPKVHPIAIVAFSAVFLLLVGWAVSLAADKLTGRSFKQAWAANEVRDELAAYEKREPPYDEEDTALQRLMDKINLLLPKESKTKIKVYISYRRSDTVHTANRLYESLKNRDPNIDLLIDIDIAPGVDFVTHIQKLVSEADVVLVLIGRDWVGSRADGRRLGDPNDFVAIEIAAALARDIRVIPVLVDGAHMPKASELPDSLKPLARRQAVEVRHTNFNSDAEALVKRLREALDR